MVNALLKARISGIAGMILSFIGFVGSTKINLYFALDVIGILLFILSIKIISDYYNDNKNFKYAFIALIISLTGYILSFFLTGIVNIGYDNIYLSLRIPVGLFILTLLISSIFLYIPYSRIANLTNIKDFDTGSFLILAGFILAIVLIGFLLIIIGFIYMYDAYSELYNNKSNNNFTISKNIQ